MDNPYPRRNGLIGFLPIVMMGVGVGAGTGLASLVDAPELLGALVGAVAGFLISRAILRRSFR